jgi:hypothetical protein
VAHGERLTYEVLDLGGGQVDGIPPQHIQETEAASLVNWIPLGSKIRRRQGTLRITTVPYAERITSLFPYKVSLGTWLLLAGVQSGVAKLVAGSLVPLPVTDGHVYTPSIDPWHFRQYRDEVLAARRATGTLKRVTADLIQDAGIPAPVTAPTLADGGAGGLIEAGDYIGVFTYANSLNGAESNPSPPSNTLTLAALRKRAWSGVTVSPSGQVDTRRLYVTLANQTGEYFFAGVIPNNFDTTFLDNSDLASLGRQVSFDNNLPPDNVELVEIWRERAWVSDGRDLFFSNIIGGQSNVQGFGAFNLIPVSPDDGHRISVLHAHGSQLIVGKTNAVYFVTGAGGAFALDTLSDKHGCIAPLSMQTAERLLFWYSGENVYRSDGINVVSISTVKVRKALDAIPDEMREKVVGAIYPRLSLYILQVSRGTERNDLMLAYNFKTDVWTTFELADAATNVISPSFDICTRCPPPLVVPDSPRAFAFLGDFYDASTAQVLYGALYDGHVYQFFVGKRDMDTRISARYRGKALGFDQGATLKGIRRVSILCPSVVGEIELRVFRDGVPGPAAFRVVSLDQPREWKRISLSTMGALGATNQIGIGYEGDEEIDLAGFIVEAMSFKRKGPVI